MSDLGTHSGQTIGGNTPPFVASGLTPEQIASACRVPIENARANWPLILKALEDSGIDSPLVQVGVAATVATETGSFKHVVEKMADPSRQAALAASQARYSPFHGRGFVQITWEENYRLYGSIIGVDLVKDRERAADPDVAAKVLAAFFKRNHVADACKVEDWRRVRKLVNGGLNGWDRFMSCVQALLEVVE